MVGKRNSVHVGELLIEIDISQVAIEESEPDRGAIIDGLELCEALRWQSFKVAHGEVFPSKLRASGCPRAGRSNGCGKFFGWNRLAVKPALPDIASEPEQHVGLVSGLYA